MSTGRVRAVSGRKGGCMSFYRTPLETAKSGAGCMLMCRRTGRFLYCLRPDGAPSGGTWSLWGGKSERGENSRQTAVREVMEETGYRHEGQIFHLLNMKSRTFEYDTFLMVVEEEFAPRESSECQGHVWVPLEDTPRPMHWGLQNLLSDRTAASILVKSVEGESGRPCAFVPLAG